MSEKCKKCGRFVKEIKIDTDLLLYFYCKTCKDYIMYVHSNLKKIFPLILGLYVLFNLQPEVKENENYL